MSNDRILRTLQQDVEIPEVVRKKADQAFAKIRAEQEETGMDNKKVVSYNKKRTGRKVFSKRKIAAVAAVAALATATRYGRSSRLYEVEHRHGRRYAGNGNTAETAGRQRNGSIYQSVLHRCGRDRDGRAEYHG